MPLLVENKGTGGACALFGILIMRFRECSIVMPYTCHTFVMALVIANLACNCIIEEA